MIGLRDEVRDVVSGFQGVAVAKTEWLAGCLRITVQPPVNKDGELPVQQTFDETMLEVVSKYVDTPAPEDPGGPLPFVPRRE